MNCNRSTGIVVTVMFCSSASVFVLLQNITVVNNANDQLFCDRPFGQCYEVLTTSTIQKYFIPVIVS